MPAFQVLMERITDLIINPLIGFMFALALVYFLWGMIQFIIKSGDSKSREDGKMHLIYGILGMAVMASVFGILRILANTFGFDIPG